MSPYRDIKVGDYYGELCVKYIGEYCKLQLGRTKSEVICSCGKNMTVSLQVLQNKKDCGCGVAKSLVGKDVSGFQVSSYEGRDEKGNNILKVSCVVCGLESVRKFTDLNKGKARCRHTIRINHGHSKTRTYNSWAMMRFRCNNIEHEKSKYYIGKGITYQKDWEDFEVFLKDLGERPENTSLDRIDGNKGYFKDNCRWADDNVQCVNKTGHGGVYSKYKGAYYRKDRGTWFSSIQYKSYNKHLGSFKTEIEAALAWDEEAAKLGLVTNKMLGLL